MAASEKTKLTARTGDSQESSKSANSIFNMPSRSKRILVMCTIANFFSGCSFSVMAPFYPREAEKKGMGSATIGLIFSIFELIIFLSSPVIGNYLTQIGPKFTYASGTLVGGVCNILFGTLNKCPPGASFIGLSFATRAIQALGYSACATSSFAIVSNEFPDKVATTFGIQETANCVGLMLGPVIGGLLYELGGFGLPFYVVGLLVLVNGSILTLVLPSFDDIPPLDGKCKMRYLLCCPMVTIPMLSICFGAFGLTFMEPILAKHLVPFGLTTAVVSLFFVITPVMNSVCSVIWGYLSDKKDIQGYLLVIGHFVFGIGFLTIGPSPLLPFIPFEISTITIGLVLVGSTLGILLVVGMKCMIIGALESGFEDSLATYGRVSGLFNCTYTCGGFFGPMLGGILAETFGNRIGFTVAGLVNIAMSFVTLGLFTTRYWRRRLHVRDTFGEDNS